ncbi:MAG: ABC transporter permease [Pseudomonadota bacterium]
MLTGFSTLFYKEVFRFWKVSVQTIVAPVINALLYLMIFSHVMREPIQLQGGSVPYIEFLLPGLVMMAVLQNAFANSSSSLIQSKITGNIIFILLPPLSPLTLFLAYTGASMVRGIAVGLGVFAVTIFFVPLHVVHPLWMLGFIILGSALLGVLGLLAGLWAEKFDQISAFQNFIIMPLTFLSGVFYSVHSLPPIWSLLSRFNPFFYLIDGFRFAFFGFHDVSPWQSLSIVLFFLFFISALTLRLLFTGYKLKH